MFCKQCGSENKDGAKFCAACGTPVETPSTVTTPPQTVQMNRQAQWSSQWNSVKQPQVKPKVKSNVIKWIIPFAVVGVIVVVCLGILINSSPTTKEAESVALNYINENYCSTFGDKVDSIEKTGRNHYKIRYDINQDYNLWKLTGTVKLSVYKNAGDWMVDVEEANIEHLLKENENWYYIAGPGNREHLIKMIAFDDDKVTLECYSYSMGSYGGPDKYDHETVIRDLEYDSGKRCFKFTFLGDWQLRESYVEYNQFEVGAHYEYHQSSPKDFITLTPANPDDYWWYEKAKMQTGNYGADSATDISQAKVGDIISIGKCEMDNDTSNGLDDIPWLVIDENDSGILVISKYCIAKQETSSSYETWETSIARKWLNGEFYNNAFTTEEKDRIITSTIVNDDNADTGMDGGNNTSDKLFLLSIDEANKYFTRDKEREAYGTLYLQELVGESGDGFSWWLRTPGKTYVTLSSKQLYQSYVGGNGFVYTEGGSTAVYNIGLRPAMWISKQKG